MSTLPASVSHLSRVGRRSLPACVYLPIGAIVALEAGHPVLLVALALLALIPPALVWCPPRLRHLIFWALLVVATLSTPPLIGGGGSSAPIRVEDLLLLSGGAYYLGAHPRRQMTGAETACLLFLVVLLAALVASSLTVSAQTTWRDALFLIHIAKFYLAFAISRSLATRYPGAASAMMLVAATALSIEALFGVGQYIGVSAFSDVAGVFGRDTGLLLNGDVARRAFGTMGNPNYFGFACAVGAGVSLTRLIDGRRSAWLWSVAMLGVCAVGVAVSGSRSAMLALLAMAPIIIIGGFLQTGPRTSRVLTVIMLLLVAIPSLQWLTRTPLAGRFFLLSHETNGQAWVSWTARQAVWAQTLAQLHGHWLTGIGPSKAHGAQWLDSDLIRLTRDFGVFAALTYVGTVFSAARGLLRVGQDGRSAGYFGIAMLLALLIMGLAAEPFYNDRTMTVIMLLLGLLFAELPGHHVRRQLTPGNA